MMSLRGHEDGREDNQCDTFDLEANLRDPVEEGRQLVAPRSERGTTDREGRRSSLRTLQAGEAGEQVGQAAQRGDDHGLDERQMEDDHGQRAVDAELYVPQYACPQPDQPAPSAPAV